MMASLTSLVVDLAFTLAPSLCDFSSSKRLAQLFPLGVLGRKRLLEHSQGLWVSKGKESNIDPAFPTIVQPNHR